MQSDKQKIISDHMAALARRSHAAQRKRFGRRYAAEMKRRGKLGGRPTGPGRPQLAVDRGV